MCRGGGGSGEGQREDMRVAEKQGRNGKGQFGGYDGAPATSAKVHFSSNGDDFFIFIFYFRVFRY